MELTTIALLLVSGVVGVLTFRNQAPPRVSKDDLARWRDLVETCELQDIAVGAPGMRGVRALSGDLQVSIENDLRYGMAPATAVTIRCLARTLAFRTEGVGTRAGRALGGNDTTVEDPEFDRTLYAEGLEPVLRALLDRETRRRLLDAFGGRVVPPRGPTQYIDTRVTIGDGALRIAAAEALAMVGTTDAVLALKAVEARSSDRLQKAAREAIARIQERQVGAHPGQLTLATGPEGQVALTEDERGRVALPDDRKPV